MKKAVCLVGCPNESGSTARLMAQVHRGLADAGFDVQTFYLSKLNISYCHGCGDCQETHCCVQHDDMDTLVDAMRQADVVCIGSPSYWGGVTAQLKTFIDRSTPLCDTLAGGTTIPKGKVGIALAVRAGTHAAESMEVIDEIEHFYGHLGIKPVGRLHFEGISSVQDIGEKELQAAYLSGRNIFEYGISRKAAFGLAVALPRDAATIAELQTELFSEEGINDTSKPKARINRIQKMLMGEYCGILAWVHGRLAGYFLYREVERHGKHECHLEQQYVRREYRNLGLPTAALKWIVEICFRDAETVSHNEWTANPTGRMFWNRSGCVQNHVKYSKHIPVFSTDDPFQIVGWEERRVQATGWKPFARRAFQRLHRSDY